MLCLQQNVKVRSINFRKQPRVVLKKVFSPYLVQMWENMDQNNSKHGQISRTVARSLYGGSLDNNFRIYSLFA